MVRRLAVFGAVAVALCAAVTALGAMRSTSAADTRGVAFRIVGTASGLYPGGSSPLRLTVHNRRRTSIVVRSIAVHVGPAGPRCGGSVVRVRPFKGALRVRALSRRSVAVRISMSAAAPDACRGARFPLVFRGHATVVPR